MFSFNPNSVFCDFLKGSSDGGRADLCSLVTSIRTQRNKSKLCQGRFRLDIKKKFFTERGVDHWKRFAREVVMAPKLPEFNECLDDVFGHIVYS